MVKDSDDVCLERRWTCDWGIFVGYLHGGAFGIDWRGICIK